MSHRVPSAGGVFQVNMLTLATGKISGVILHFAARAQSIPTVSLKITWCQALE
jgi:hypothetical protein